MNGKAAKFIADGLKKSITSFFKSKAAGAEKAAVAKEVEGAFASTGVSSALSKWLKPLLIANVADSYMYDIPVLGPLLEKLVQAHGWVVNNTIGKIPGVGEVLIKAGTFGGDIVTPRTNKLMHVNDPKYYENTDMHIAFGIPFNYPDTDFLDYGQGVHYASICVLDTASNHLSDSYAAKSRLTQVYDLLKGVRGLSGKQPYSVGDLFYYHINSEYLINEYCRLKFALRLAQLYVMTKARLPINLLEKLGWNAEDFIANRALYKEALTTLANYITNTHPVFGVDLKRIEGLWSHLIPDSNDKKVALFYKVNHHLEAIIPDGTLYKFYNDAFEFQGQASAGSAYDIKLSPQTNATRYTYANYSTNMLTYISAINDNEQFNPIRADLIGAFGASAIWTDPNINEIDDNKFDDIIHPFDELFLTVIQNATSLIQKGVDFLPGGGISDATYDNIKVFMTMGTINTDGTAPFPVPGSGNNAAVRVQYQAPNTTGTAGNIVLPQTDGAAIISTNGPVKVDSTIVIANKYNMKESEQIEILQLTAMFDSATNNFANNYDYLYTHFITQSICLIRAEILFFDPTSRADSSRELISRMIALRANPAGFSDVQSLIKVAQFWSQADYGLKVSLGLTDGTDIDQSLLLDMNIMGSVSRSAFVQSVRYATYSLLHGDIKLTEAKKLGNIVDIYNIKQGK